MSDHAPYLERAFGPGPREDSYALDRIEGDVPDYVRGTYYLNGPARFERGGSRYRHWLDGDGMVVALRFDGGGIRFTSRYVRGPKFRAEEECGRPVFRAFGTAFPGDRLKWGVATESPLNVGVHPYRGRLLASGEQSLPVELDADTLETRGPFDFGRRLNAVSPFAAHPKADPVTGELFNFGVSFAAAEPCLTLYRFTAGGDLAYRRRLALPYPCSVHDFALSRRYAVFHLSPYLLDVELLRRPGCTTLDALSWEPERGSRLLVVERDTGEAAATVSVGRGYCLHLVNAFDDRGRLTVDVLEFEKPVYDQYLLPDLFTDVSAGRPVRLVVDAAWGTLVERRELDFARAPDFPATDPRDAGRPYSQFWCLGMSAAGRPGRKFFDQLARADWDAGRVADVYRAPPGYYLGGEPVVIADPRAERGGVVLCPLFDAAAGASAFALFDAFALARGPAAVLPLRSSIHLGFHATFHPVTPP